jgi:hypothetical protein
VLCHQGVDNALHAPTESKSRVHQSVTDGLIPAGLTWFLRLFFNLAAWVVRLHDRGKASLDAIARSVLSAHLWQSPIPQ